MAYCTVNIRLPSDSNIVGSQTSKSFVRNLDYCNSQASSKIHHPYCQSRQKATPLSRAKAATPKHRRPPTEPIQQPGRPVSRRPEWGGVAPLTSAPRPLSTAQQSGKLPTTRTPTRKGLAPWPGRRRTFAIRYRCRLLSSVSGRNDKTFNATKSNTVAKQPLTTDTSVDQ